MGAGGNGVRGPMATRLHQRLHAVMGPRRRPSRRMGCVPQPRPLMSPRSPPSKGGVLATMWRHCPQRPATMHTPDPPRNSHHGRESLARAHKPVTQPAPMAPHSAPGAPATALALGTRPRTAGARARAPRGWRSRPIRPHASPAAPQARGLSLAPPRARSRRLLLCRRRSRGSAAGRPATLTRS